jgi:hypothetical protein
MKTIITASLFTLLSASVFADKTINTETNSWKSVPITVDEQKHTYNVSEGYLLPEGDYYYTYSGYRCLKTKLDKADADPVVYNDAKSEGHSIYCYPEK